MASVHGSGVVIRAGSGQLVSPREGSATPAGVAPGHAHMGVGASRLPHQDHNYDRDTLVLTSSSSPTERRGGVKRPPQVGE